MIVFSNKSTRYSVSRQGEHYRMDGSIAFLEDNRITELNATVYDLEDKYIGNFYYSETADGKCNKNLNNVPKEYFEVVDQFIDETLVEIKSEIPE